ncbi:M6 family metalloprotease domain-containing protein [uncultured Acetobacteroides sp.]|uniref:M6 family metalloprotease domain-containing protein n=1 Tax=uncultured Acetobacteroides sp. TaxID=1760811 RepID=UPI0029F53BDC|nr:M6 family metalloprotease domain-containing protein [uncultured Acetobacteroides sp.]
MLLIKLAKGFAALTVLSSLWLPSFAQNGPTRYAVKDHGIPAYPNPVKFEQPDGKTVTLSLKGDGALHWAESADGYKLVKDAKGFFCYGVGDAAKGMVASDVPASDIATRTSAEKTFISTINREIQYSPSLIQQRRAAKKGFLKSASAPQRAFPTSGSRKLIAILVNFSDVKMQRTREEFNNLFNQKEYSVNKSTGSVADFFSDNSFGKMSLSVDVVGPYTVSKPMSYYGSNDSDDQDTNPDKMVSEAVALANADVDFSQYDNDKNGVVDGVYVIFAGYGEEAGASADAIWSHAWQIPTSTLDGVKVSSYSCSPELMYNAQDNPNAKITTIGVICHEFSHVCGLPDYYDTDYEESGGESPALGKFDPMSSGSWNNNGNTPPLHNSYSRNMLGWGTLKEFDAKKSNTLLPHYSNTVGYVASTEPNEYYIFENRQKVKWDECIPGRGMVVYHVVYNNNVWSQNIINNNPTKEYFELVDAGTSQNSSSSPFPGTLGNKSFTAYTSPAFKNWDGTGLNMPLLNITETGENITVDAKTVQYVTFTVKEGTIVLPDAAITINGNTYNTNSSGSVQVEVSLLGSKDYTVSKNGYANSNGTITTDDDTSINVNLLGNGDPKFIRLMNGTTPLPNVKVTLYGNTLASDANGNVQIPQSSSAIIQPTFEFNSNNKFSYSIALSNTGNTTDVNFKEVVVSAKSRIGAIATAKVNASIYASITLGGTSTASFYVPMLQQSIPYTATLNEKFSITGTIGQSTASTDTIKLWYNTYSVYAAQGANVVGNVDVQASNGEKYTTNLQGFFSVYLPIDTEGITFTVSSDSYQPTSKYLNNLSSNLDKLTLNLVSRQGNEQFTIAPNPTTAQQLYIYSKNEKATIYVYSNSGLLVHTQEIGIGSNQIQSSRLTKGLYIVKIKSDTHQETKKIIVI